MSTNAPDSADIRIEKQGALNVVTLDRPTALNALTCDMRAQISALLPNVARDPMSYAIAIRSSNDKAFSVGGDVREIIGLAKTDMAAARQAFGDEYFLNWQHECFSKPTISLIDGLVMGSGVGITAYGTHRVAGKNYAFAMPETAIGLFPDVGVCHLFSRMPHHIGLYLGLTGRRIDRATAYHLGLVTHCIDAHAFDQIIEDVADVQPVDPVLDTRHADPGPSQLQPYESLIEDCFGADSVRAIISRLQAVGGSQKGWAEEVVRELQKKSPTALGITFKHIRQAKTLDLRQTLLGDYTLAAHCLSGHDFSEGVRAALIDKDADPKWRPGGIEDVTEDVVTKFFRPVPDDSYTLPTRSEMQAARS